MAALAPRRFADLRAFSLAAVMLSAVYGALPPAAVGQVVFAGPQNEPADNRGAQVATPSIPLGPVVTDAGLGAPLTASERDKMYMVLGEQAAQVERNNILKTVVKLVGPTVVHIEAEKRSTDSRGYGRVRAVEETGSGVIIAAKEKFFVLTNRHVVKDAELADVKIRCSDGRGFNPTQIWSDPETDVAVMAIAGGGLLAARLGNSDMVDIGDFVLAVGSPFGLSHSVTYGIISAKGRRDLELADGGVRFQDFMQTDASINPGNSGGPLINLRGEVVGINTAIATNSGRNEGVGFSIPINMAMVIARQLIEHGAVSRAFLGVTLDAKFTSGAASEAGLPRRMGARIIRVAPKSPAEAGQLRAGDVVVQFNGTLIDDDTHLVNVISGFTEAGAEVPVLLYRDRQPMHMTLRVGSSAPVAQTASQ